MLYKKFMLTWTLGHLTSSDTLPPPLSKDEEEALMQRLILGDTSVRRTLIERNLRLVAYIARKFENTGGHGGPCVYRSDRAYQGSQHI